jgi:AcrR family transcriptional regulator
VSTGRRYRLGKRETRREEARAGVVEAALVLLRAKEFELLSLNELAKRSGVGRTTVFEIFGSKAGLLRAVEAEVGRRAGVEKLIVALQAEDAAEALAVAFRQGALVWGAERLSFRRLFGQASVDAALETVMAEKQDGRRQLCRVLARKLARQKKLRTGVSEANAAQLLWLLTSFHAFDALADSGSAAKVGELQWKIAATMLLR